MEVTYEDIKSLIIEEKQNNNTMECKFQVSGTQDVIPSRGVIYRKQGNGMGGQIKSQIKSNLLYSLKRSITNTIASVVGGGFFGRTVQGVVSQPSHLNTLKNLTYSAKEKQDAVLRAFEDVSKYFHYDEKNQAWKLVDHLSDFQKLIRQKPIKEEYNQEVLTRMLVELANADGHIADEEKTFLQDTLGNISVDELLAQPALTIEEMRKCPMNSRESMYVLTVAMALSDDSFEDVEKELLKKFQDGFQMLDSRVNVITNYVKAHFIEQLLAAEASQEDIQMLAKKVEMSTEELEKCITAYHKKVGKA